MADEKPAVSRTASARPHLGRINTVNDQYRANAHVQHDGRVKIHFSHHTSQIVKYFEKRARHLPPVGVDLTRNNKECILEFQTILGRFSNTPKLNIAIHIVGSRGDVQPFIAIGQELIKPPYGHRVRICTHPVFKDFVEENGLEFFSIGGDPATLMAYMVKNPGLMPGIESLKAGDVGKRRADMAEILEGCWRSCIEPGDGMSGPIDAAQIAREDADKLFIADAIIANPPSYGHIHCAEKLGIPLHMMFTMPWSPTQYFPHPLASIDRNESDANFSNYISYTMMELLAWQGLGDIINGFRTKTLLLDPISPLWGHMLIARMKVPFTYLWSSALIPKPADWGPYIHISGFSFLSQASTYKPADDLVAFLKAGPPPVYIGFGSIVVDHPEELTKLIFGAVKRAGVRALVSKGWGGLGGGDDVPEGIFMLGNVPHDWLFQYVSCVVHHGGAGTTAIGIAMGKPTVVVPFFGDQPFWGAMIHRAGAGPEPVPFKRMTEESLAESITLALESDIKTAVKKMSEKISSEHGAADAAASFHDMLNMDSMRCLVLPDRVAVWRIKDSNVRLSSLAVCVLIENGKLSLSQLKLIRHRDWYVDEGAADPILGAIAVASGTFTNAISAVLEYSRNMSKAVHQPPPSEHAAKEFDSSTADEPPYIDQVYSHNPVSRTVANYNPDRLEGIAYSMASKTLPAKMTRQKQEKAVILKRKGTGLSGKNAVMSGKINTHEGHEHGRVRDATLETGHFGRSMAVTVLRVPVSLFYNLANGCHNAPSFLLNDNTVRRRDNITGFGSGVQVACKEVGYGFYDGVTGLVTHPYRGAQKDGVVGFGKGVGRGMGGLVFKTGAAAFGITGYTLKGVEKQLEKRYTRGLKAGIIMVRLKQGLAEFERASEDQRNEVLQRWQKLGVQ